MSFYNMVGRCVHFFSFIAKSVPCLSYCGVHMRLFVFVDPTIRIHGVFGMFRNNRERGWPLHGVCLSPAVSFANIEFFLLFQLV